MVSTFPLTTLELKFVSTCARKFDHPSRTIRDQDGNTIISLDPKTIDRIFRVPPAPLSTNISKKKALERWKGDNAYCIKYINDN